MNYTSLHNHLDFSSSALGFPDSINKLDKFIQHSYNIGLNAVAITDHCTISSYVKAQQYYEKMKLDRPFKIILGVELYLLSEQEDIDNRDREKNKYTPYYHAVMNALDKKGNEQIRRITGKAWERSYHNRGLRRRPSYYSDIEEIIGEEKGHVVFHTACLGGLLPKLILKWREEGESVKHEINDFIQWGIRTFGRDYFLLEIQPCYCENEEQIWVNEQIQMLGKAYKLRVVPTTDSHYLTQEDRKRHKAYLNSKDGGDSRETDKFYATTYVMKEEELRWMLQLQFDDKYIDELFKNTNYVASLVEDYSLKGSSEIPLIPKDKIPKVKVKHAFKSFYETHPSISHYANNEGIYQQYFWFMIEKGLLEKKTLLSVDLGEYIDRIETELAEVKGLTDILGSEMCNYFTTMAQIIKMAWTVSLVGVGRGSAGAFVINWLLDITAIDPVPLGKLMPHWRFMSTGRSAGLPDIDVDIESDKKDVVTNLIKEFWGEDKVLNIVTFAQLTSKTAIEKACKGLGVPDEVAGYLKSLIVIDRGKIHNLTQTLYGDEKKGVKPNAQFVNEISKYEDLAETALAIEGLIVSQGIHAAAVNIYNEEFYNVTSCMIAKNGSKVSAFDLHDEEWLGSVKFDLLSIDALGKIRSTLKLLLEDNLISWHGNLKSTYDHYLNPINLEYDCLDMWKNAPRIYGLFQFDTAVGSQALNKIEPTNIMDLTVGNSLMRLQSKDGVSPLDLYKRYKDDINEWYKDMREFGLNEEEIKIMEDHLLDSNGIMDSQERTMLAVMDTRIAGLNLKEADRLRKAIAKASKEALDETEEVLYRKGYEHGTRKELLDYIWWVQIELSKAYSFSSIHSYEYSTIGLQELNLYHKFNPLYWNCGALIVDASAEEDSERESNSMDYGKISKAICKMKFQGIDVISPNINNSSYGFKPDIENNAILFSLKALTGMGDEVLQDVVGGRPYSSFKHFYDYHKSVQYETGELDEDGAHIYRGSKVTNSKIVTLIKAGCFDFETTNRIKIMKYFAMYETPTKETLTTANMPKLMSMNVTIPRKQLLTYRFRNAIINKGNFYCQDPNFKSKKHYKIDNNNVIKYLMDNYIDEMNEGVDYYYIGEEIVVVDKSLEKAMKKDMEELKTLLIDKSIVDEFNKKSMIETYNGFVDSEDENKWALESLSFYDREHELQNVNKKDYNVTDFLDLPEEPKFELRNYGRGKQYRRYELSRIMGTIISCKHDKSTFSLLTTDGVVEVRMNKGQYAHYKKTISHNGSVVEKAWIARNNKLLISGYRNGDNFQVKKYADSLFQHSVALVKEVNKDGTLELQVDRFNPNEDEY